MTLKHIYIYIYMLAVVPNYGQVNLVPNYSFEDTLGSCQSGMGITPTGTNTNVKNWYTNHIYSSPDYYNTCANSISYPNWSTIPYNSHSYQNAHNGNAYIGISTYGLVTSNDSVHIAAEYISVKLKQPLKTNICYYAEYYINLANICLVATNQIGMLFGQTSFTTASWSFTNTIQPQVQWDTTKYFTDTLNWVKISGKFTAQGGEQYLTIGDFKDGYHLKKTAVSSNFTSGFGSFGSRFFTYILIDDVSLYELPAPQLQSSYVICPTSDSLVIGDTARIQTRYQWYANGLAIDTTSYITIKPSQTTTYVLHTTNCGTNTQTVVVTYSNNCEPIIIVEPTIPNVFTPNGDGINDVFTFSVVGAKNLVFGIYNRWGNLIQTTTLQQQTTVLWDGRTTSGEECASGVYFYTLEYTDANGDVHKKNGYVSLIR
jgi:gliding motility-associated-like protein